MPGSAIRALLIIPGVIECMRGRSGLRRARPGWWRRPGVPVRHDDSGPRERRAGRPVWPRTSRFLPFCCPRRAILKRSRAEKPRPGVELRGFEPLTPHAIDVAGGSRRLRHLTYPRNRAGGKGAAEGWVVGRREVTCSADFCQIPGTPDRYPPSLVIHGMDAGAIVPGAPPEHQDLGASVAITLAVLSAIANFLWLPTTRSGR